MSLVVKHSIITGASADPTALVDGPAWDAAHSLIGIVGLDQGGTGSNLSTTGGTGNVLKQISAGAVVTVGSVSPNEIYTTSQTILSGSTVTVQSSDSLVVLNKGTGSATAITLPLAASKNGAVLIVDFKGDSDANPITVATSGSEKFPGNSSSWTISSQGISVQFTPIPGLGYAVR